jgi:hypothetical protein
MSDDDQDILLLLDDEDDASGNGSLRCCPTCLLGVLGITLGVAAILATAWSLHGRGA